MGIEGSGATRAGGQGLHNEDAFLAEQGLGLYVVCDGASGTPAGEIAARVASDALEEFVERAGDDLDLRAERVARAVVERALPYAMDAVVEAERTDPELRGLATTVTLLLARGDVGVIGHRGDSRAYLVRGRRAHQLTVDHELTDAVEGDAPASDHFEVFSVPLEPGDTVILCTDGAEQVVQDPALVRVAGELTPPLLASRIVSAAHRGAPSSDATAVVVRVHGERERRWLELSSQPQGTSFGHTLQNDA